MQQINYATSGDGEFDYGIVSKIIDMKKENNEEPEEEQKDESKEEAEKEQEEEKKQDEEENTVTSDNQNKINNPKTGDTIIAAFVILIASILGITFIIKSNIKQNQ